MKLEDTYVQTSGLRIWNMMRFSSSNRPCVSNVSRSSAPSASQHTRGSSVALRFVGENTSSMFTGPERTHSGARAQVNNF